MAKRKSLKPRAQSPNPKPQARKQPRTASLPGMEDHAIRALDNAAAEYADIRDQRMELTRQEVDLKARALKLMKKHGKTRYQHNGVSIEIVSGDESIKVKVKKVDELPEDSDADAPEDAPDDEGTGDVEDAHLS